MTETLVMIHALWRWVVVLLAVVAIVLAVMSATGSRPWDTLADRISLFLTIALDIQVLLGIIIWLLEQQWSKDPVLGWLHPLGMLVGLGLAHVGRARSDRAADTRAKGTQALLFFGASLVVIIISIPWGI